MDDDRVGYYNFSKKEICFNYSKLIDKYDGMPKVLINMIIVQSLVHEFTHALHYKIMDSKTPPNNDAFSKASNELINFSYLNNFKNLENFIPSVKYLLNVPGETFDEIYYNFYKSNHDIFPMERICDLDGCEFLKRLVLKYENNEVKQKRYYDIITLMYYRHLLVGYDEYQALFKFKPKGPSDIYLKVTEQVLEAQVIENLQNEMISEKPYDRQSLLYLGLTVNPKTIKNIRKYTSCLNDAIIETYRKAPEKEIYRSR